MSGSLRVLWDESLIQYDFGPGHPMDPVRIALTFSLARAGRKSLAEVLVRSRAPGGTTCLGALRGA